MIKSETNPMLSYGFRSAAMAAALVLSASALQAQEVVISDPENTLAIDIGLGYPSPADDATPNGSGRVLVELAADAAPLHAERLKTLAREGFYDGVVFHRVIDGFMAQTGDPSGTGRGGSELPDLPAEFSDLEFERGVVGMARAQSPNSANSQFFIMFSRHASLDNNYTVVGRVIDGIEIIDQIKRGSQMANGIVEPPRDRMISVRVLADIDN